MKKLSQMTPQQRQARIAQLAASPATRSKIPDQYLPAQYRKARALNTRLGAPVVQGSTLTQRDVARQATAGADVKYGDVIRQQQTGIGQSEQLAKDQAGWFDDYRRALQQAQANTQKIGDTATQQIGQLAGAFQAPNTAGFSAENADDATKAAAVRKAILGSIGSVQAAQAGNANTYANTLANVVAPGQKLSAQAQAAGKTRTMRDELAGLLKDRGTYKQQLEAEAVAAEGKNVLAQQALAGTTANQQTQAQLEAARIGETGRHNRASEKTASRQAAAAAQKVNQYGYTNADWQAMTTEQRQKVIKDMKKTGGGKGKSPWLGTSGQASFRNDLSSARSVVSRYRDQYSRQELAAILTSPGGRPASTVFIDPKTKKPIMVEGIPVTDVSAAKKINPNAVKITAPAIPHMSNSAAVSAALDAIYNGHLSPATIQKLHEAGVKVKPLGISTKRPRRATRVQQALSSVGEVVGNLG